MKKVIIIICLFLSMFFSGCDRRYDTVEIRLNQGDWTVLGKAEAEKIYRIIQKFESSGYREMKPDDMEKGGLDFFIRVSRSGSQTVYDTKGPEWAKAMPDRTYHAYKVNSDFYSELAGFYENYYPLLYPVEYSPEKPEIHREDSDRFVPDQESIYRLYSEIRQSVWEYPERDEYDGNYDDEICSIVYDDSVIKETVHLFDGFMVINGRKLAVHDPELIRFILPDTEIPAAGLYSSSAYSLILQEDRSGTLKSMDMEYDIKLDISRQIITGLDGEIPYRYKEGMLSFEGIGGRIYLRKEN